MAEELVDHRTEAERTISWAGERGNSDVYTAAAALVSIGHSLIAITETLAAPAPAAPAPDIQPLLIALDVANDKLAAVRELTEDAEHWIPSVKHGAVIPVDVLQKALAGGGTPAPEPCRHERQRNAGTQISPLMVCDDCGVQVTPAWGPGKDAE